MTGHTRVRQTRAILSWVLSELADVIGWWLPELLWFGGSVLVAALLGWLPLVIPACVVAVKVLVEVFLFHEANRLAVDAEFIRRRRAASADANAEEAADASAGEEVVDADLVDEDEVASR